MTSPVAPPPCPHCEAPLTAATTCARCGLRLTGPEAARLWEVDQALAGLDVRRTELLGERGRLLATLRPGTVLAPATLEPRASTSVTSGAGVTQQAGASADWMQGVAA